jgi:uncharacterized protein (DUF362 family)
MNPRNVAVAVNVDADYHTPSPFHPPEDVVEAPFPERAEANDCYLLVRRALYLAGLDRARFGTPAWNPLADLVKPGDRVLVKPNFVKESHPRDPAGWRYVLTNGAIIRAAIDYLWKALDGRGTIWVGDAPQTDSSFTKVAEVLGLNDMITYLKLNGVDVTLVDLRQEEWISRDGVIVERQRLAGDPRGYVEFDLGQHSEFKDHHGAGRYYGADYDSAELNGHHSNGKHEYKVAASAIVCDVLFSIPKLKTHKKTGITVSLKNLVGINGDKNWLPHHTEGNPATGGDEHPDSDAMHRLERRFAAEFRQASLSLPWFGPMLHRVARRAGTKLFGSTENVIRSGNWWGNDTTWRMCLDLNRLALYGDSAGQMPSGPKLDPKRHLVLVDGVIAGEGRGPMNPDPVAAGLVLFGANPASVDAACAILMGFDPERIPVIREAFRPRCFPITDWGWREVRLLADRPAWNTSLAEVPAASTFRFSPHFGWAGKIERQSNDSHEQ